MRFHVGTESGLLLITAIPPATTFAILASGEAWGQLFISSQMKAGTLFSLLSFGSAATLSSLELGSERRLPAWNLRLPTLTTGALVALTAALGATDWLAPSLIANLFVASVLYRVPHRIFLSRTLLLAQFLPIVGKPGLFMLAAGVAAAHIHLWYLGVYRQPVATAVSSAQAGSAWLAATTKEMFYRGHYLLFSSFGLANEAYAVVLKFVDILSRPSDYLFQRLVDHGQIRDRLRRVTLCTPLVGVMSAAASLFILELDEIRLIETTMIGIVSALVFLTKYIAFEHNAELQFGTMTVGYLAAMLLASPSLLVRSVDGIPLPYMLTCLLILSALLLGRRIRQDAKNN